MFDLSSSVMIMSLGGHPNDRKVTFGEVNTRSGSWGSDRNKDTMQ